MKDFFTLVIEDLKAKKQKEFKEHEEAVRDIIERALPQKSKILTTNLIKKIYNHTNELNIVLEGHLYLERLLNEVLSKNLNNFETLEKKGILNSFYKKATYLLTENITPSQLLNDILTFNQLRNKYAHKLNYDIVNFDMFRFSFLEEYYSDFNIKRKKEKRILNRILIKHVIFHLMTDLTNSHRFLHLVDE